VSSAGGRVSGLRLPHRNEEHPMSVEFGYTLSSEEHGPRELVAQARRAEEAGFEFLSISDHFHPWVEAQGHSPFVWSVLGAVAQATERVRVGVGVTCPTIRIHPAIVAQAVATTSLLFEGRFFFGVGSGEALNEHILGDRWPPADVRLAMLEESVEVMRKLWTGDSITHRGEHYTVENARLFDPPAHDVPVIVSGFGPKAVELAGRIGDGYWGHSPETELLKKYEEAGGTGHRYAQINVCWATDEAEARKTAHHYWPNTGMAGQLAQDLPTVAHFEDAATMVSEEDVAKSVTCGPDPQPIVDTVKEYADAGYTHLYFHQIGPDQEGFVRFWTEELRPALAAALPG
jgi:coenzyme F420-dependent glucose-6-phosphate dehydrogenase